MKSDKVPVMGNRGLATVVLVSAIRDYTRKPSKIETKSVGSGKELLRDRAESFLFRHKGFEDITELWFDRAGYSYDRVAHKLRDRLAPMKGKGMPPVDLLKAFGMSAIIKYLEELDDA